MPAKTCQNQVSQDYHPKTQTQTPPPKPILNPITVQQQRKPNITGNSGRSQNYGTRLVDILEECEILPELWDENQSFFKLGKVFLVVGWLVGWLLGCLFVDFGQLGPFCRTLFKFCWRKASLGFRSCLFVPTCS